MAESSRRKLLVDVVNHFFAARRTWVETGPDHITRQLEDAVNDLLDVWSEGTVPGDLRRMERVISLEMRPAWDEFTDRASRTGDTRELPSDTFWAAVGALERIEKEARPRHEQTIESIEELTAQKVSDNQICEIYGWKDEDGAPELWRLREERAKPGTHTQNWLPPAARKRQEQEAKEEQIRQRIRQRQQQKLKRLTEPCKESLEELIEQGLSARQIAQMRRCTIEEVFDKADELGLDRPALEYASPNSRRGAHEPELSDEAAAAFDAGTRRPGRTRKPLPQPADAADESELLAGDEDDDVFDPTAQGDDYDDLPPAGVDDGPADELPVGAVTLEQEIIQYHQAGLDPHTIAENVSQDGKKVGVRKVNAILKRFAENPRDFASAE